MGQIWGVGLISTIILLGVIDDIRSQRYHNTLFIFSITTMIIARLALDGGTGLLTGTMTFGATFLIGIPLWKLRILGAGDVKLFSVIAVGTDINSIFMIFIYSLIWGSLLSLASLIAKKELMNTVKNWLSGQLSSTVKIPYTVAILLGWAQWLVFQGVI